MQYFTIQEEVSVPIRGLFNLTQLQKNKISYLILRLVSVPIRGLFNLTHLNINNERASLERLFPSPSGDYLI